MTDLFSLSGRTAMVTGASHGIGFAIASALYEAGARVVFNTSNQLSLEKGLAAYAREGIEVRGFACDITDEESVKKMLSQIEKETGAIDILVNNAAIIKRIPMIEMTVTDFRKVVDVDLTGAFIVSKAVLPRMIEKQRGKIINICSLMSELGRETLSAYAAAKGGLKMLTRNIASEYGHCNIQCNAIAPGYMETEQTAPLRQNRQDGTPHSFNSFIVARTPAARWGKSEDLKGAAIFLASAASDFVNGQIIYVDGGIQAYIGKQPS